MKCLYLELGQVELGLVVQVVDVNLGALDPLPSVGEEDVTGGIDFLGGAGDDDIVGLDLLVSA